MQTATIRFKLEFNINVKSPSCSSSNTCKPLYFYCIHLINDLIILNFIASACEYDIYNYKINNKPENKEDVDDESIIVKKNTQNYENGKYIKDYAPICIQVFTSTNLEK